MKIHGRDITQLDYLELKERIKKGGDYLKGHWFEEEYEDAQNLYNILATRMLEYEIENDLLPEFEVKDVRRNTAPRTGEPLNLPSAY